MDYDGLDGLFDNDAVDAGPVMEDIPAETYDSLDTLDNPDVWIGQDGETAGDLSDIQNIMDEGPETDADAIGEGAFFTQGNNEYGYEGTCGPTSIANTLNRLLESSGYSENDVLTFAVENQLCETNGDPASSGGTTTEQFMEIYDKLDIPGVEAECFDYDNALDADQIAERLDQGSVVNISVDSARLWDQTGDVTGSGLFGGGDDVYSDHWITVTGVDRQDGGIAGFNIIDSGGGESYVDADKFNEVYFGTEDRRVIDPTCIVVSKTDVTPVERITPEIKPSDLYSVLKERQVIDYE